jgi:mRNA interferase MazF
MNPLKGHVFWVQFPGPVGRRPVCVVQNNVGNQFRGKTIVATLSTVPPKRDYEFLVPLDARVLGEPSWVHCEEIFALKQDRLLQRVGALAPAEVDRLDSALSVSLGLPSHVRGQHPR